MTYSKVDGNHVEVVDALRKAGCTVQSIATVRHGCPDLLVGIDADTLAVLMEVKNGSKAKLSPDEQDWHARWNGKVYIVHSPEHALEIITQLRNP